MLPGVACRGSHSRYINSDRLLCRSSSCNVWHHQHINPFTPLTLGPYGCLPCLNTITSSTHMRAASTRQPQSLSRRVNDFDLKRRTPRLKHVPHLYLRPSDWTPAPIPGHPYPLRKRATPRPTALVESRPLLPAPVPAHLTEITLIDTTGLWRRCRRLPRRLPAGLGEQRAAVWMEVGGEELTAPLS